MAASITFLADAATEGKHVVVSMLIVGLIFVSVIALGQFTHWARARRKARRPRAY